MSSNYGKFGSTENDKFVYDITSFQYYDVYLVTKLEDAINPAVDELGEIVIDNSFYGSRFGYINIKYSVIQNDLEDLLVTAEGNSRKRSDSFSFQSLIQSVDNVEQYRKYDNTWPLGIKSARKWVREAIKEYCETKGWDIRGYFIYYGENRPAARAKLSCKPREVFKEMFDELKRFPATQLKVFGRQPVGFQGAPMLADLLNDYKFFDFDVTFKLSNWNRGNETVVEYESVYAFVEEVFDEHKTDLIEILENPLAYKRYGEMIEEWMCLFNIEWTYVRGAKS